MSLRISESLKAACSNARWPIIAQRKAMTGEL